MPTKHTCHTFNRDGDIGTKVEKVGRDAGLMIVLQDKYLGRPRMTFKLFLHEPGVLPDVMGYQSAYIDVPKGQILTIAFRTTITDTTNDFHKMSFDKRKCVWNSESNYHDVNCYSTEMIRLAMEKCQCKPWFIDFDEVDNVKDWPVCFLSSYQCYYRAVSDTKVSKEILSTKCQSACDKTDNAPYLTTQNPMQKFLSTGQINLSPLTNLAWNGILDPETNVTRGTINPLVIAGLGEKSGPNDFEEIQSRQMTVITMNFGQPTALQITKDAKVTFSDKVGNIGGTFGIFLGISMIGLFDIGVDAFRKLSSFMLCYRSQPKKV